MEREIIGWIGTAFVLISFGFDGSKLRILNSVGAGLWLYYGIVGGSGSIMFLNGSILCIHIYKLLSIKRKVKKTDKKTFLNDLKKIFKKSTRYE